DTNWVADVFLRDRATGTTQLISADLSGVPGNWGGLFGGISADGRFACFESLSSNLVASDTNGLLDVFVRDLASGVTELVSVDSGGVQGNAPSDSPAISSDGRFVAFVSVATNLVAGDTNSKADVFVRDRQTGTTERVSVSTGGNESDADGLYPS